MWHYFINSPRKREYCNSGDVQKNVLCLGSESCSPCLSQINIFASARVQDSHTGQAVIIPSQIKAMLERDSESLLAHTRGCGSTRITYSYQLHCIQEQLIVPFGEAKRDIFEL